MADATQPRAADTAPATPRVRILPDPLIDQIAAGEVVERPASVVKELVENALDAGATRVRVEVREGGAVFIAVTDDGFGMLPDDALLALERHATSKLASAADLQRIATYGFRGEALPAIASVSRLRLRTRAVGAAEGFEVLLEGGKQLEARVCGGPEGTRVEVADLFGQVPARRKFLKSPVTEWTHVADWLARAALARPDVHFDLVRDERPATSWPATRDPLDRIAAVLSEGEAAALLPVAGTEGRATLQGYSARPDFHRASADGLHLYVNGRPVRDRLLRHAVLDVYRDLLPRGRFPTAVLFLSVPPEAVDVNVHPAKWEVRFADPRGIHQLVTRTLGEAIGRRSWLAAPPAGSSGQARWSPRAATPGATSGATQGATDWIFARDGAVGASARAPQGPFAAGGGAGALLREGASDPAQSVGRGLRLSELRLVGQLLGTYLVLEARDALLLVDQHAAHERVLYERLRADWQGRGVARQACLVPVSFELAPADFATLAAAEETVLRLGFEVEPFGAHAVAVRAVPALLADRDPESLVRSLAQELGEAAALEAGPAPGASRLLPAADHLLATLACHAARRKGDVLDPREQQALLAALDAIPWAPCCPHGRPVAIPIALAEIERRFGRR